MNITDLKYLHITCAILSYLFFFVRGVWMLRENKLLQQRWVKILPHIIDTILLVSAIILAVMLALSPLNNPWLLSKIIALLLYIVLGTFALKRGKTKQQRLAAWLGAQLVFFYMISVALTHNPLPWQAL